ncbi:MAG: SigE family polymerase sigma factor [Nocardioides sp.]|nr:SigE family polymerase sigma factor [Nocardioides sp.]
MKRADRDAAYVEFVLSRQTRLRRAAYAICGDWHRADDLLQTALTKLYVAWPRLERQGGEEAYVRRILLSSHLDDMRRASSRREIVSEDVDTEHASRTGAADDRDELIGALQRLPEMQRKVVVLRQVLDLSVEQTAAELGIATGTVKSHHSRGVARLHELLTDNLAKEAR